MVSLVVSEVVIIGDYCYGESGWFLSMWVVWWIYVMVSLVDYFNGKSGVLFWYWFWCFAVTVKALWITAMVSLLDLCNSESGGLLYQWVWGITGMGSLLYYCNGEFGGLL